MNLEIYQKLCIGIQRFSGHSIVCNECRKEISVVPM